MERIIYSAPFGNWIGQGQPGVTPTLGTFTLKNRGGLLYRLWRMARTLRYSPLLRAWVNRLGLPNPGIENGLATPLKLQNAILSLHGFDTADWLQLLDRVEVYLDHLGNNVWPLAIELNLSCPNVKDDPVKPAEVMNRAMALQRKHTFTGQLAPHVIVKIPPVRWSGLVECAVNAGVHFIHACNTLPVKRGGMSGKPLKPISLGVIETIRRRYGSSLKQGIIGGGGITSLDDIRDYHDAGADHFAIGSALFNPFHVRRLTKLAARIHSVGLDATLSRSPDEPAP